jgi:hypothetical protein
MQWHMRGKTKCLLIHFDTVEEELMHCIPCREDNHIASLLPCTPRYEVVKYTIMLRVI